MGFGDTGVSPILGWSLVGFIGANMSLVCIYLVQLSLQDLRRDWRWRAIAEMLSFDRLMGCWRS